MLYHSQQGTIGSFVDHVFGIDHIKISAADPNVIVEGMRWESVFGESVCPLHATARFPDRRNLIEVNVFSHRNVADQKLMIPLLAGG